MCRKGRVKSLFDGKMPGSGVFYPVVALLDTLNRVPNGPREHAPEPALATAGGGSGVASRRMDPPSRRKTCRRSRGGDLGKERQRREVTCAAVAQGTGAAGEAAIPPSPYAGSD